MLASAAQWGTLNQDSFGLYIVQGLQKWKKGATTLKVHTRKKFGDSDLNILFFYDWTCLNFKSL